MGEERTSSPVSPEKPSINFFSPFPWSSSESSSSSSSTSLINEKSGSLLSDSTTPLFSNLTSLLVPRSCDSGVQSPIDCKVLSFQRTVRSVHSSSSSSSPVWVSRRSKKIVIMEDEDNNSSCTRVDSEDFTDDVVLVEARCQEKVAELPRVAKVVANGNPDLLAVGVLVGDGSLNVDEEEADFPVDADTSDEASLDNVPNNDVAIDACVPIVSSSAFDLTALAKSVFDEVNDPHLTEEENLLVMSSSVNTKKYEKSKRGVEQRFFDTIEKFGGEHLRKLTYYAEDGFTKERLFYIKLRGEKSQEKHFILNKCLVKIALKWRNKNQGSSNFGKHLQPSSWATLLKGLFAVFRKKNIQYNYATDFNGDGEFHAVLASMWEAERAIDPTFATGVQTSTCDMEADYKIRQQYKDGKFNPFNSSATEEAFRDRLKYCIWVLGRYLLCRGRNEIVYSTWKQVIFNSCKVGDVTEESVEYRHHWDKSHKCKLKNTTP
jgi:hypothetical protein